MAIKKGVTAQQEVFHRVRQILDSARTHIARTVNSTQVVANWLIGREIVEEEQRGKRRASYGTELLHGLAAQLKADFGTGYGVDNLELFRRFYLDYPMLLLEKISDAPRRKSQVDSIALQIPQAVSAESWQPGRLNPNLSWTHYRRLLRVTRAEPPNLIAVETTNHKRRGTKP